MTKRLVLMRHAKSSWDDLSLDDHARPLNARGRKAARAIGSWLTSLDIAPDMILCSDAVRTQETHQRLKVDGPVHMRPDLYLASLDRILTVLQGAEGDTVMLIGHNPGIGEFANRLVMSPPPHGRFVDYPTGATLVADLPIDDWRAAHFGTGRVVNFLTPRELTG